MAKAGDPRRTDLDALPVKNEPALAAKHEGGEGRPRPRVNVMHTCGHDVHMTNFIGTARALSKLRDQWKSTVVMIRPAGGGACAGAHA